MTEKAKATIEAGKAILGIEFGSTRIKAVLIDENNNPIAQGSHECENKLVNGASAARRNRRQRYDARLHAV